jgi:hypothetical protein
MTEFFPALKTLGYAPFRGIPFEERNVFSARKRTFLLWNVCKAVGQYSGRMLEL